MTTSARVVMVAGALLASVASWPAPSLAVSFADLPPDWVEVSLLQDRLRIRAPKGARLEPPTFQLMAAPEAEERVRRLIIDSGLLRLVALVGEMFRVSAGGLAQHGPDILKEVEGDTRGVRASMVRSEVTASGLEIFQYEPRAPAKIGDANLVSGMLMRHPDGTVQFLRFCVNDAALADLPAARRLIADMVASLRPGPRPLPSGARVQLAGNLVLDLLPGYTAYRQEGPDFDVYWIEHLVPMGQPAGRLGLYSGHHPQPPAHPPHAREQKAVLFGVDTLWYVWEGPPNPANVRLLRQEAHVRMPGGQLIRHVFFYAITQTESVDFQRIAESATFP
jgi:hypothetical protein